MMTKILTTKITKTITNRIIDLERPTNTKNNCAPHKPEKQIQLLTQIHKIIQFTANYSRQKFIPNLKMLYITKMFAFNGE